MSSPSALKTFRVGKISYVNTAPFYQDLFPDPDSASILEGSPAEINLAMREGRIDFAPISSLEYALRQDEYAMLPGLCIGSRDFARSVLLLSHERVEGLNREKIILSDKSLSSQALLKILLKFKYQFENEFESASGSPEELLQMGKAALAIGDEALFFRPKKFVFKYDLSELWWNWAKLPFCFAVWAVRREFLETRRDDALEFCVRLKDTVERNTVDLEKLIREALGLTIADERFGQVFGYLFNLNYCLDEEMMKGLRLFYDHATRAGLSPAVEKIHWCGEA